ncbi:M64 family metallopeptidase [Mucilaginibacter sp. CSA2-8R]|uniref:M64 family metallopeptidase n=1 Tax=Mucilaginibacter sp. CSA2-8R TaxID=3141542 RepID=UPI00315D4472
MRIRFCVWACLLGLVVITGCKKDRVPEYHTDGEVRVLMKGDPSGPNIVFLGDGFIKEDLVVGGDYDRKVKELTDHLFSVPPFNRYKKVFNVYQVYALSNQRGALNKLDPQSTATKFKSYFSENDRLLREGNYDTVSKYLDKIMPYWQIQLPVVLVNDSRYGGSGGGLAVVSVHSNMKFTFVHETGHTFGLLADEYVEVAKEKDRPLFATQFYPNVDTSNNPATIKWKHYFNRPRYAGIVGIFEGGYYHAKGVYRPEENSVMRNNITTRNFNAPSREAIVRRIYEIMGKPFDLEAFFKEDLNVMGYAMEPEAASGTNFPPLTGDHINQREQLKMMQLQRLFRQQQNKVH